MNAHGDETANDPARALAYREFVRQLGAPVVDNPAQRSLRYWSDVRAQITRLKARGVIVAGGLPTTFEEVRLTPPVITFMQGMYRSAGACFIALPNRSLYPRQDFFDDAYHLQRAGQLAHSRRLAPILATMVRTRRCP